MNSNILNALLLFIVGQAMIWFQTNGQFIWSWAKENTFIMALCGLPISYLLIIATKYMVEGFDGLLWPGRLVGFINMVFYGGRIKHKNASKLTYSNRISMYASFLEIISSLNK